MIKRTLANLAAKCGILIESLIKSKDVSINCPICQSKLLRSAYIYAWSCPRCPKTLEFKTHSGNQVYLINISPKDTGPQGQVWLREQYIHIWDTNWIKPDEYLNDDEEFGVKVPYTNQSAQELINLVNRVVKLKAFL